MRYSRIIRKYEQETWLELSTLGSFTFGIIIALFMVSIDSEFSIRLIAGMLLVEGVSASIKTVFHCQRPESESYSNLLEKINSGSFPSVHAGRVMLYSLSVISVLNSIWGAMLILLLTALVGISRIVLRKHYVTDVLGGYALGFIAWYLITL